MCSGPDGGCGFESCVFDWQVSEWTWCVWESSRFTPSLSLRFVVHLDIKHLQGFALTPQCNVKLSTVTQPDRTGRLQTGRLQSASLDQSQVRVQTGHFLFIQDVLNNQKVKHVSYRQHKPRTHENLQRLFSRRCKAVAETSGSCVRFRTSVCRSVSDKWPQAPLDGHQNIF